MVIYTITEGWVLSLPRGWKFGRGRAAGNEWEGWPSKRTGRAWKAGRQSPKYLSKNTFLGWPSKSDRTALEGHPTNHGAVFGQVLSVHGNTISLFVDSES